MDNKKEVKTVYDVVDEFLLTNFTEKENYVARLIFGFYDYKMHTVNQVYEILNKEITIVRIRQILFKVFRRVRHPFNSYLFNDNMDLINNTIEKYFKDTDEIKIDFNKIDDENYSKMVKDLYAIYLLNLNFKYRFIKCEEQDYVFKRIINNK